MLQAYMDESYEVDGIFVIAGYISTAERWDAFSREWEAMLPQAIRGRDGVFHFHMKEMARPPDRLARVSEFHDIIQRHALMGVRFVMDVRDFGRAISRLSVDNVRAIDWEEGLDPYYVACRLLIELFHNVRTEGAIALPIPQEPVDFIFDHNFQAGVIGRMWELYMSGRTPEYRAMYGARPVFATDADRLPLQAADFHAWWSRRWAIEHGVQGTRHGEYHGFTPSPLKLFTLVIAPQEVQFVEIYRGWLEQNMARLGMDPEVFRIRDNGAQAAPSLDEPGLLHMMFAKLRERFRAPKRP